LLLARQTTIKRLSLSNYIDISHIFDFCFSPITKSHRKTPKQESQDVEVFASPIQPRIIMSSNTIAANDHKDINLENPNNNGNWTIKKTDGIIEGNKLLSKVVMSIAVPDTHYFTNNYYGVKLDSAQNILYARELRGA